MNNNEKIIDIIKSSPNLFQSLTKLGWDTKTSGYRRLRRFISSYGVDISHFETPKERFKKMNELSGVSLFRKTPLEEILIENSTFSRTALKQRLYDEGLKNRQCELCGQDEIWKGKKMSLILDHKNGVHNDNRIENLQILCPNCNSTLDTFCGKNKKNKKTPKPKLGYTKETYMQSSFKQRRKERPSVEILKSEIKSLGYLGTGRKYGVSDNAIRKWEKAYAKYAI